MKLLIVVLLVGPTLAFAQFKCVGGDGKTAYQQTPCAGSSEQQRVVIRSTVADPVAAPVAASQDERRLAQMTRERRIREMNDEIVLLEERLSRRNALMVAELDFLRSKKGYANNNLAGATWEQSISSEMQAVTQKYKPLNDVDVARITQLRTDLAK